MVTPRRTCRQRANHILCIVTDAHDCHAMTEELIDTWWNALAPEAKAEIYEASLDAEAELTALNSAAFATLDTEALRSAVARGEEALRAMLDLAGKGPVHG